MCGIFALLNNRLTITDTSKPSFNDCFFKGSHRGPEHSFKQKMPLDIFLGFHRLAINGLDSISNQPITCNNITLICNGEIYNYRELYALTDTVPTTDSDCEVIIHLYIKYGIEYTLHLLDGVFAFVLVDFSMMEEDPKIFVARDPYGVRPLYQLAKSTDPYTFDVSSNNNIITEDIIGFASELKQLVPLFNNGTLAYQEPTGTLLYKATTNMRRNKMRIEQFEPGSYTVLTHTWQAHAKWRFKIINKKYSSFGFGCFNSVKMVDSSRMINMEHLYEQIRYYFCKAVEKRVENTDRPVACLLSGGLDSSLVTAIACQYSNHTLETYSIGLEGSEDLKNAEKVAQFLGTKHTSVIISEDDFFAAIPEVIHDIESYDTTTVRASVGNYLIGEYISEHSQAKVILNGDGADEHQGGYLYFHKAPDSMDFDAECRRLLTDIHMYDVLRSDKCISSHGLEPRTPFLDREWIQFYLSIPATIRNHNVLGSIEKHLIRTAFKDDNLLPPEILWRRKEAFSDGVSSQTKSWFEVIQDRIGELKEMEDPFLTPNKYSHLPPKTDEQLYYRNIYEYYYPNQGELLPYFWMPKFVDAEDPSARTLGVYSKGGGGISP